MYQLLHRNVLLIFNVKFYCHNIKILLFNTGNGQIKVVKCIKVLVQKKFSNYIIFCIKSFSYRIIFYTRPKVAIFIGNTA